jgi:protein-tyrosine phosphatase
VNGSLGLHLERPMMARRLLKAVRTHPIAIAVKVFLKDVWWDVKGRRLRNPPLPRSPRSLLFVCLGNICRSPFAGALTHRRLEDWGWSDVRVASAGIRTTQAARCPTEACEAASAYGVSLETHEPQPVTRTLLDEHDLVLVMEASHLETLRSLYPDLVHQIFLLPLLERQRGSGFAGYNIADPFAKSRDVFDRCYRRIDGALTDLLDALAATREVSDHRSGSRPSPQKANLSLCSTFFSVTDDKRGDARPTRGGRR